MIFYYHGCKENNTNVKNKLLMSIINQNKPEVGTFYVNDLFNKSGISLSIPEYQRPYVWSETHISELISDWKDHFYLNNVYNENTIEYYLGTIMVYKTNDTYEIIDGQQRLTTLLIMDYVWNEENSVLEKGKFNFSYQSNVSIQKIKENRNFLNGLKGGEIAKHFNQIIKKLVFSIIITESEDKAFVFFESQNNRGVPLDEVDFFKSFHLRELKSNEKHLRFFAKKFDQINSVNNSKKNRSPYKKTLNELFIKQFWIIRYWSKNKLNFPNRRLLLATFQKQTIRLESFENPEEVRLYPSTINRLGSSLIFNRDMKPEIKSTIKLYGAEAIDIPFTINQPIQRGIGFFLYTEKYSALNNFLFLEKKIEELNPINELILKLYNVYFVNLYQCALVLYFDKFGDDKIVAFAKWVEHYLGAFRMNRSSIVEQSPIVLLRDFGNILLDMQQTYLPNEVLEILKNYAMEYYYQDFKYGVDSNNEIFIKDKVDKRLSPARQNYYQITKEFYSENITSKNYQLTEKHNWINASLSK